MPELPEVETVRQGLERLIIGRMIKNVEVVEPKSFPNDAATTGEFLLGAEIIGVHRRAKMLLISLSSRYTLLVHLKMTGQLVFVGDVRFGAGHPNESLIAKLPDRSTRVILGFEDGSHLYFNDQRKFGWMKLLPTTGLESSTHLVHLGPEPLEDDFSEQLFTDRIRKRTNTNIKAALLDQTVLAGVGNIYADESLWGAKIHPARKVAEVTNAELNELYRELLMVLRLAIEKGGNTDRNYVNAEGKKGSYIDFARVFRREKLPCPRCETIIIKTKVAGRGTHVCPVCQLL